MPNVFSQPQSQKSTDTCQQQTKQKKTVLLVIYGEGGHRTEMALLLGHFNKASMNLVSLGDGQLNTSVLEHFQVSDVRNKHSRLKSLLRLIPSLWQLLSATTKIYRKHKVTGVISTGPGLCVLPMLLFRIIGVKTVFVETYCRFESRSFTGRVMSKVAHRFLVQNKQLLALYPGAEYCGRV